VANFFFSFPTSYGLSDISSGILEHPEIVGFGKREFNGRTRIIGLLPLKVFDNANCRISYAPSNPDTGQNIHNYEKNEAQNNLDKLRHFSFSLSYYCNHVGSFGDYDSVWMCFEERTNCFVHVFDLNDPHLLQGVMRKTGGIDINVAWTLTGSRHGLTDLAKSSIWRMRSF
jgi:hypothetical protein